MAICYFHMDATAQEQPVATEAAHAVSAHDDDLARLLSIYGLGATDLDTLKDGRGVDQNDLQIIHRALRRLPGISQEHVQRSELQLESRMASTPDEFRGRFVRVRGQATEVSAHELPADTAERFGYSQYYRTVISVSGESKTVVYSRAVPRVWLRSQIELLDEPCACSGFLLKTTTLETGESMPLFVADRIQWFPDRVNEQLGVGPSHIFLASLGLDIGLFDQVRHIGSMRSRDRDCFYALMSSLRKADPNDLRALGNQSLVVADAIRQAESKIAKIFTVRGIARRAVRVQVTDQDIRQRFGIGHYWQLDIVTPLSVPIEFVDESERGDNKVFGSYPITVCVTSIPQNMAVGERIREEVSVAAVFLKLWLYRSSLMSQSSGEADSNVEARDGRLQPGPLLVGISPQLVGRGSVSNPSLGGAMGIAFVALVAIIWVAVWRQNRRDRDVSSGVKQRYLQPPHESWDQLDGPASNARETDSD